MMKMANDNLINEASPWMSVYLHLRGQHLNPNHITDLLSIEPTRTRILGQTTGSVSPIVAKNGYWGLCSKKLISPRELDVNKHLDVLLRFSKINFFDIDGVEEAEVDIFIQSDDEDKRIDKTVSFEINQDHLRKLNELGVTISVTVSL